MVIGITFGTYDLFHIGHVNLLRNARNQCDFLVVGISSASRVFAYKNRYPIISDNDRMAVVESCRYVDKVFLNDGNPNDPETYFEPIRRYGATKWFVGDDWKNTEKFNTMERLLLRHCKLIYLPHTDGVSTTSIKSQIISTEQKGKTK